MENIEILVRKRIVFRRIVLIISKDFFFLVHLHY